MVATDWYNGLEIEEISEKEYIKPSEVIDILNKVNSDYLFY